MRSTGVVIAIALVSGWPAALLAAGSSAFDFMTPAQIADVRARSLTIDVSKPIQAWLNHCSRSAPYTACYLPAGAYNVGSTTLNIAGSIKIEGDGRSSGLYWTDGLRGPGLLITQPHVIVTDILLNKPTRAQGVPDRAVIGIDVRSHTFTARNLRVESSGPNRYQGWGIGIRLTDWTHHIYAGGIAAHLYAVHSTLANAVMIHGGDYSAQDPTAGATLRFDGGVGNAVLGSNIEGTAAHGIYVSDGGNATSGHGTMAIHGNYMEGQTRSNIYLLGTATPGKNVRGISIVGNLFSGGNSTARGVELNRVSGVTVAANLFINHAAHALDVGAIATDIDVQPSNVFTSGNADWQPQRVHPDATGVFAATTNSRINYQNYALTLTSRTPLHNRSRDDFVQLWGGDSARTGAGVVLFGQLHAGSPRRGQLASSADGRNVSYSLAWGSDPQGRAAVLGFFDAAPVAQPSTTGQTAGHVAGDTAAAAPDIASAYTGGRGSRAYTVGDLVRHLKDLGLLAP